MKLKKNKLLILYVFIGMLFGCSTVGRNFDVQRPGEFRLAEGSFQEYQNALGIPFATSTKTANGSTYKIAVYMFAESGGVKMLRLEFKNDLLNAFVYLNSLGDSTSRADIRAANTIVMGQSKEEVLSVLGEPSGKSLCPNTLEEYKSICVDSTEVWYWGEKVKEGWRELKIAFGADSKVVDTGTVKIIKNSQKEDPGFH